MSIETICRRKSDGLFFEPSRPDGYTEADAVADLIWAGEYGGHSFFFRRVRLVPWHLWGLVLGRRWQRTGETWAPESGEFEVMSDAEARGLWMARER